MNLLSNPRQIFTSKRRRCYISQRHGQKKQNSITQHTILQERLTATVIITYSRKQLHTSHVFIFTKIFIVTFIIIIFPVLIDIGCISEQVCLEDKFLNGDGDVDVDVTRDFIIVNTNIGVEVKISPSDTRLEVRSSFRRVRE